VAISALMDAKAAQKTAKNAERVALIRA